MNSGDAMGLAAWVRRRRRQMWVEQGSAAGATALVAGVLATQLATWPPAAAGALAAVAGGLVLGLRRARLRVAPGEIAAHLDRVVPELEESSELLLEPGSARPLLARLQQRRAAAALAGRRVRLPGGPGRRAAAWWAAGLALSVLATAAARRGEPPKSAAALPGPVAAPADQPPGPGWEAIEIEVEPPAYTGRPPRRTTDLSLEVEEGSAVSWRVTANTAVESAEIVFDGDERLRLEPAAGGRFEGTLVAASSRLYWLRLAAGEASGLEPYRSPFARLTVVPDRAPEVEILAPAQRVGEVAPDATSLPIRVRARDDHGVGELELVVTLASGAGETVRFRERRLALAARREAGEEAVTAAADLDPGALGMEPGSELYLVAEARDRRQPRANTGRSDARIVRMPGPRVRSADLGAGLPPVALPELFRSQRQIILDTEKLVADRRQLTAAELARRSEAVGFDQRALRMRYAGLLGEEFESGVPGEADEEEAQTWPDESGDDASAAIEALPEGFVHSHDWAEVNTYFDDRVRRRLREALREMWGAEGRLRSVDPEGALPFEYRALTALKSAQEAERVYVRKTGFEPPPLEMERRLTGELDEVGSRIVRREAAPAGAAAELLTALEAIRALEAGDEAPPGETGVVLRAAAEQIAAAGPALESADLEALSLLRDWSRRPPVRIAPADAERVEAALWRALPHPPPPPAVRDDPRQPLWGAYRRRLGDG